MIAHVKSPISKKVSRRVYRFGETNGMTGKKDGNFLPFNVPELAVNLAFDDGAVRHTKGFEAYDPKVIFNPAIPKFEHVITNVFQHNRSSTSTVSNCILVVTTSDLEVYMVRPGLIHTPVLVGKTSADVIGASDFRQGEDDVCVLSSLSGLYMLKDDKLTLIENAPGAVNLCTHNNRMYAIINSERGRIWFSDALDVTNWNVSATEGGYIDVPAEDGHVVNLVSRGDYLYVFTEFAVWRLSAYGDQREFSFQRVTSVAGRIAYNSVVTAGDYTYYKTDVGFYRFDGYSSTRIMSELDKVLGESAGVESACFTRDVLVYSILAKNTPELNNYAGEGGKTYLMVRYCVTTGKSSISEGYPVRKVLGYRFSGDSALVTVHKRGKGVDTEYYLGTECEAGTFFGEKIKKIYRTGFTDLGYPDKRKLLRSMTFTSKSDFTLKVNADGKEHEFKVYAGEGVKTRIKVPFKRLSLEFETSEDEVEIVNPTAVIDLYD